MCMPYFMPIITPVTRGGYDADPAREVPKVVDPAPIEMAQERAEEWDEEEHRDWFEGGAEEDDERE